MGFFGFGINIKIIFDAFNDLDINLDWWLLEVFLDINMSDLVKGKWIQC